MLSPAHSPRPSSGCWSTASDAAHHPVLACRLCAGIQRIPVRRLHLAADFAAWSGRCLYCRVAPAMMGIVGDLARRTARAVDRHCKRRRLSRVDIRPVIRWAAVRPFRLCRAIFRFDCDGGWRAVPGSLPDPETHIPAAQPTHRTRLGCMDCKHRPSGPHFFCSCSSPLV